MNYGIVSEIEKEETKTIFKARKIQNANIYPMNRIEELLIRLNKGDMVICLNVNRFPSVSYLFEFYMKTYSKGIAVKFLEQPYLNYGNGKQWRKSIVDNLKYIIYVEENVQKVLMSNNKINKSGISSVTKYISLVDIIIVSNTYSSDGILHRGS